MRLIAIIACVCLLTGCRGKDEASPAASSAAPAKAAAVEMDRRDQYALVRDIGSAQTVDANDDPEALARVTRAWQGRRYRWELAYLPALCQSADRCVLAPFDHARFERRVAQGWLPRLELDDKSFAALRKSCHSYTQCIVEIDARLAKLRLSTELPTQVSLDSVEVRGARQARPNESWVVAPHGGAAPKSKPPLARR